MGVLPWLTNQATPQIPLGVVAFGMQTARMRMSEPCDRESTFSTGFVMPQKLFDVPLELDSSFNIRPGKVEVQVPGPFSVERTSTASPEWQAIPGQPAHAADQQTLVA